MIRSAFVVSEYSVHSCPKTNRAEVVLCKWESREVLKDFFPLGGEKMSRP